MDPISCAAGAQLVELVCVISSVYALRAYTNARQFL